MKFVSVAFTPTKNRRLNELIGFLLFVSALLLFLALASYSPADPSLNTASSRPAWKPTHNWIGIIGAYGSDFALQMFGIAVFFIPVFLVMLGMRWWRSRPVDSYLAKLIGSGALFIFFSGLLGLLPWHWRWLRAVPPEGLVGRIVADLLLHLLNTIGAYIVSLTIIAIALYLCTAFSFGQAKTWLLTRFAFVFAAWQRFQDWRAARAKVRSQKELEKPHAAASKLVVAAKLVQAKRPKPPKPTVLQPDPQRQVAAPSPLAIGVAPVKSGIERTLEEVHDSTAQEAEPGIGTRADIGTRAKTTMPQVAGGYKLPSSALLHRPEDAFVVDEEELKNLVKVLTEKCAEFDVHG